MTAKAESRAFKTERSQAFIWGFMLFFVAHGCFNAYGADGPSPSSQAIHEEILADRELRKQLHKRVSELSVRYDEAVALEPLRRFKWI
jgi:hypothetical protein